MDSTVIWWKYHTILLYLCLPWQGRPCVATSSSSDSPPLQWTFLTVAPARLAKGKQTKKVTHEMQMNQIAPSMIPISASFPAVFSPRTTDKWGITCSSDKSVNKMCKISSDCVHLLNMQCVQIRCCVDLSPLGLLEYSFNSNVFTYISLLRYFMLLTSTFGTTSRSDIFALSSMRLFQSSMSMVLWRQRTERDGTSYGIIIMPVLFSPVYLVEWLVY